MRVILLDLDNTLVSTERRVLETDCMIVNEVMSRRGLTCRYTPRALKERFIGLGFTRIMRTLAAQHQFEVTPEEMRQLAEEELERVVQVLETKVEATPGAHEMLAQVCEWQIERAVVSSSELRRITTCLRRTGLERYIPAKNVFSATDSLPVPEGKPSSAIYKYALQYLGVPPEECLAVEDNINGVVAGVGANIKTVGYLGTESCEDQPQSSKKLIAAGATETFCDWVSFLDWLRPQVLILHRASRCSQSSY